MVVGSWLSVCHSQKARPSRASRRACRNRTTDVFASESTCVNWVAYPVSPSRIGLPVQVLAGMLTINGKTKSEQRSSPEPPWVGKVCLMAIWSTLPGPGSLEMNSSSFVWLGISAQAGTNTWLLLMMMPSIVVAVVAAAAIHHPPLAQPIDRHGTAPLRHPAPSNLAEVECASNLRISKLGHGHIHIVHTPRGTHSSGLPCLSCA